MKTGYFVIGDIHGHFDELVDLLKSWDEAAEQLVFLGDYIDRGPDSAKVVALVKELVETKGAIALKGNHEDMLKEFLEDPIFNAEHYLLQGGYQTMLSYGYKGMDAEYLAEKFNEEHGETRIFLENLPFYYETADYIFVHAGVNLYLQDWHDSNSVDFLWIREQFHRAMNLTGKRIVFGHTPTCHLNANKSFNPWENQDRNKLGIDGGICHPGGKLWGVSFKEGGIINAAYFVDTRL